MKVTSRALFTTAAFIALGIFAGCATASKSKSKTSAMADIELFNGQNFDGWTFCMKTNADPMQTWSVSNGVIQCTGHPFGYIRTKESYHDYKLTCVWRFVKLDPNPKVNNSGIFVHIKPPDVVFPEAIQCQGLYQHQGDLILEGGASSDGHQVGKKTFTLPQMGPPNENAVGEWNTNEVICQGNNIGLFVNGKTMNAITGCNLTNGFVGIQSEGGDIEIRRMFLAPLQ